MYIFGNGGFTLDGTPAKDLQIVMSRESDRPILPNTVDSTMSIAGRNGIIDMGATLGARQFSLACKVITKDYRALQKAIEQIASVLVDVRGKPRTVKLVFDVNPDRYYLVRYSGSLSIDRLFGLGQFTLPLLVVSREPFANSLTSSDSVILDSDIVLDSDIMLDDRWDYYISSEQVVELFNWGTMAVKPLISLQGSFASISITVNGKTFNYTAHNGLLIIDCEKFTVKKDGINTISNMTGDFIELNAGTNQISISGTSLSVNVSFIFEAKFYG